MASSASVGLGFASNFDASQTATDSNNSTIKKTLSSGNGETVYGFKTQMVDSTIGSITTSDYGAIAGALGLAQQTVDNANTTFKRAADLTEYKADSLKVIWKPLLAILGAVVSIFFIIFFFGRRKRGE